jgi:hypothetical protein
MPKLFHIVLPGLLAITLGATAGASNGAPATLEEALEERGWSVHRTFAGDLYLFAPSEENATTASTEITAYPASNDPSTDNIDLQTLGNKLETAGWKVEHKADGALEFHPRETAEEATTQKEAPAPSAADEQWIQMQQQLKAAGWDASREADGSLVLIPPGEPVEAAAPEDVTAAPEKQADSIQTMQTKLRETGWQVTENSDGSIIFYPPKQQHREKGTIHPASGHAPPADFDLPVTSWSQARSLTLKWLKQQSPDNLTVGKIREIYYVYLVSILSNSRSDRLKHQIAIRMSDGHIIVLK